MLNKNQIKFIESNNIVVLATADDKSTRRAIFVEADYISENRIVISNNAMKVTENNLKTNDKVFLLAFNKDYSKVLKISGKVKYETEGKWYEYVKKLETNKNWSPKGAVIVNAISVTE